LAFYRLLLPCMAALEIIESVWQKTSIKEGFSDDPNAVLHMSAMWLLLKFFHKWVFWGFCGIVQNEFFYTELPKSMSSVASNLFEMGLSAAKLVASLIITIVRNFMHQGRRSGKLACKQHQQGALWMQSLAPCWFEFLVNFIYYLGCSKAYGPCKWEDGSNDADEGGVLTGEDW